MYLVLHFPFSCGWRGFDAVLGASLEHGMQKGKHSPVLIGLIHPE